MKPSVKKGIEEHICNNCGYKTISKMIMKDHLVKQHYDELVEDI